MHECTLMLVQPYMLSHVYPSLLSLSAPPLHALSFPSLPPSLQLLSLVISSLSMKGQGQKQANSDLTRQRGPEPIGGALGLSWGLMACDRLFLTDSVTNFSILDGDF